ncbi:hypothetical protein AOCH_004871 [Aspergillus ochraceoroseus]|uniref:F-box domain-containing protein n=2 Tax=Aspergillus ochraceoroseus TaxID=138278 RepID=A0A0F8WRZ5_9EURO|nr:hypothetical protein AOCH_004871 [Aspergillus ochraceoroseus]
MTMDPSPSLHLYSLPNEVFVQILSPFSARELLGLSTVSHRFHALVLRLLHYRLLVSASLKEYRLILECFHPTSKLTEPHVFCKYLGTDGLSDKYQGEGSLYENVDTAQKLGRLSSLYSRFQPVMTAEESPNGAGSTAVPEVNEGIPNADARAVKRPVNLESFEDFSQLCVVVNVVKVKPGSARLLSVVDVEDGVIRIFRDWLKDNATPAQGSARNNPLEERNDQQLLWVNQSQNVGLKLRVREVSRLNQSFPILVHRDEETLASYEIYIDELHVRTTRLLLTLEKALQDEQNYPKAVVFTRQMG